MGWVSWPLFIFVFLASFSVHWWPNIWPKMGFLELLKKKMAQFISYLAFTLMGWVSWLLYIYVFIALFLNSHLCSARLQNWNLYWIFVDEVGSDQSGGTLSPFMGTACFKFNFESDFDIFCFLAGEQWLGACMYQQEALSIEAEAKWPPFRRRHFQIHFCLWKRSHFDKYFTERCS